MLAFLISIQISSNHIKTLDTELPISQFTKNIWKVLQVILRVFFSKLVEISLQEYVSEGISHPVFYGELVYKVRRVKGAADYVSSYSKIVKRHSTSKVWPRNHLED